MPRDPPESAAATFSLSMCVTARDCAIAPDEINVIADITPHMRFISTSISAGPPPLPLLCAGQTLRYNASNGHSPTARARHKYAAIPTVMTANPDAMYFHPLVVMMKIQPAMATMLGSG